MGNREDVGLCSWVELFGGGAGVLGGQRALAMAVRAAIANPPATNARTQYETWAAGGL